MNVNISEKVEVQLRNLASRDGKAVEDFAGDLLEEAIEEKSNNNARENGEKRERKHNLLKFAGMFSSGKTDTSERMHEILYSEDFDPAEGFNVK